MRTNGRWQRDIDSRTLTSYKRHGFTTVTVHCLSRLSHVSLQHYELIGCKSMMLTRRARPIKSKATATP